MKDDVLRKHSKYLFLGMFLIITLLAFLIIKSFITSLLTSIVLSYLFYPLYKKMNNLIKNRSVSAIIMVFLLIIIIFIPVFFILNSLLKESLLFYAQIKSIESSLSPEILNALNKIIQYFVIEYSDIVIKIPGFFLHAFITMFLFYYFLRDGERLVYEIKSIIPMDEKHKKKVVDEFKNITHAIVYGLILTGLIEGLSGALGFYIFDIGSPLFWGVIMMILTILPGLGTSFVWVPASIIKIFQGDMFNGIGLFVYGFFFISGVEVLLKPKFIGEKSKIHPALIVIGVFGGIKLLGFIGLFFGPLILVTFITFLKSILNKK